MDLFRKILARLRGEQEPSPFAVLLQVDERTRDAFRVETHQDLCQEILRAGRVVIDQYANCVYGTWGYALLSLEKAGCMKRLRGGVSVVTDAGRARLAEMMMS